MRVVAIIGPFRAKHWWQKWLNIRRAKALAYEVWKMGAVAYLPHRMAGHLDHIIPDNVILPGLLALCGRCDSGILVTGWQRSIGSLAEKSTLEKQGKPVFETLDELRAWLSA